MLLNTILKTQGYPLKKAQQKLMWIQQLSKPDFLQWQENTRWESAHYHFVNNAAYRAIFTTPMLPDSWNELPIVQKKHLQEPLDSLISSPYKRSMVHIGSTSGSSGHPFRYVKDKYAHAMTYALIADRYAWHGVHLGEKQARFYGIPMEGRSRRIEQAKDILANRVRFPVFDLSEARLADFLVKFSKINFRYLYGYTSALVRFARFLLTQNVRLKSVCPSLVTCIVTAEVCTSEDQTILQQAFGVPVLNEYGASELDVIAFTDPEGDWILSEENLFVEVLDDKNQPLPAGSPGKIVVTALHNRAFPMVRYETGDLGTIQRTNKNRLVQLTGRTNDTIVLPSGKTAAGLTFYYISRALLESGSDIREFIIKQVALDTFEFDIVAARPLSPEVENKIKSAMDIYLEKGLKLIIHQVTAIERPVSGKIKHFYSLLT